MSNFGGNIMSKTVSLVIVSHSKLIADGTRDMVAQMVGEDVKIFACGGNGVGGLGTNIQQINEALVLAYSERGVAILVDLGGAETNSEMAIELMPHTQQKNIIICDAPIVEGAIMAGTEASSGATLAEVIKAAEDYQS